MAASSRYMETHFLVSVIQNRHHQCSTRTFSWVFLLLIVQKLSLSGRDMLESDRQSCSKTRFVGNLQSSHGVSSPVKEISIEEFTGRF
jgi:hypothetical protein